MSEWRGLHNPERHNPDSLGYALGGDYLPAFCVWCSEDCGSEDSLCRCCLAAEVERLTGELADRDRRIAEALRECTVIDRPNMLSMTVIGPLSRIQKALRGEFPR